MHQLICTLARSGAMLTHHTLSYPKLYCAALSLRPSVRASVHSRYLGGPGDACRAARRSRRPEPVRGVRTGLSVISVRLVGRVGRAGCGRGARASVEASRPVAAAQGLDPVISNRMGHPNLQRTISACVRANPTCTVMQPPKKAACCSAGCTWLPRHESCSGYASHCTHDTRSSYIPRRTMRKLHINRD